MKKNLTLMGLFLMFLTFSATAQENTNTTDITEKKTEEVQATVSHRVQMGETVMLICKKYVVAPDDIYKLNPEAVDGISEGMVLSIPAEKKVAVKPKKNSQATVGHATLKKPSPANQ